MYISEDEALEAALADSSCVEAMVFHYEEEPDWWREDVDGPFEPFYAIACQSTGIVYPTVKIALAQLVAIFWPEEWGAVPPT